MGTMADPLHADGASISFLRLPYEIREQIYLEVLELNPRVERELSGYPARHIPRYVTVPIRSLPQPQAEAGKATSYKPLPSSRPLGYVPHNLLSTCKQIYHESRLLPFQTNEFVFVHWMTSATSYCDAVLRPMRAWQRDAIRHVRFEMGLEELSDRSSLNVYTCQLEHVCALLPGVRTMRMDLSCGVFPTDWFERDGETGEVRIREDWSGGRRWIEEGLREMRELRVVEVECSFLAWVTAPMGSREGKKRADDVLALGWCGKVEEILNQGRVGGRRTRVVAVANARDACLGDRWTWLSKADALTLSYMPSAPGNEFSELM